MRHDATVIGIHTTQTMINPVKFQAVKAHIPAHQFRRLFRLRRQIKLAQFIAKRLQLFEWNRSGAHVSLSNGLATDNKQRAENT